MYVKIYKQTRDFIKKFTRDEDKLNSWVYLCDDDLLLLLLLRHRS